jgi:hypothetical protein
VFETAALQECLRLLLHISRQRPVLRGQMFDKNRIVLRDHPVEQRLFGAVTLLAASVRDRAGRRVSRHASRPCDTLYTASSSLDRHFHCRD